MKKQCEGFSPARKQVALLQDLAPLSLAIKSVPRVQSQHYPSGIARPTLKEERNYIPKELQDLAYMY